MRKAVSRFAEAMENKLKKHDGDRGKDGWLDMTSCTPGWLFGRLTQERAELSLALDIRPYSKETRQRIREECIDVANFAMMIFDQMNHLE